MSGGTMIAIGLAARGRAETLPPYEAPRLPAPRRQPALALMRHRRLWTATAAARIGIDKATLRAMLHGHVRPTRDVVRALGQLLNARPLELFYPELLAPISDPRQSRFVLPPAARQIHA